MGLHHFLLVKQIRVHYRAVGFEGQRTRHFSKPSSCKKDGDGDGDVNDQKGMAEEPFGNKHIEMHPRILSKAAHVKSEVEGSWHAFKGVFKKLKEKIMGNSQVQNQTSSVDRSKFIADASDSMVMTSKNNSLKKPDLCKPENTLRDALCSKSDNSTSAESCLSRDTSCDEIMDSSACEANRTPNVGISAIGNPGRVFQSAEAVSDPKSKHNNVSWETCSSMVHCSSANKVNLTASEATGMHDSPDWTKLPEAAQKVPLPRNKANLFSKENNFLTGATSLLSGDMVSDSSILQIKEHVDPKELRHTIENVAKDKQSKSEQLLCLVHEVTGALHDNTSLKISSTGHRNRVESKIPSSSLKTNLIIKFNEEPPSFDGDQKLMNLSTKTIDEEPAFRSGNRHKPSERTSATVSASKPDQKTNSKLLSSENHFRPCQTKEKLQEDGFSTSASTLNEDNQPQKKWKIKSRLPIVVPEGGDLTASFDHVQKSKRFIDAFNNASVDLETCQSTAKCNLLPSSGYLEDSNKKIAGTMTKDFDVKSIIKLGKGEVSSSCESIISSRTDQTCNVSYIKGAKSQTNVQKVNNEGRQMTSNQQNAGKKTEDQKRGDADSATSSKESNASPCVPSTLRRNLDKTRTALTTKEALGQNKVIVKFLHKKADEREILAVFKNCGEILKIEKYDAGETIYGNAVLYFKTTDGMRNAIQATDLGVRNVSVIVKPASASEKLLKKIPVPSLIGDPNAPAAYLKNPTRTVAIKQLTPEISFSHIEKVLTFCESNISGYFLGSSSSIVYVEFETEEGKERALAKHSVIVLGKPLLIFRIDAPRTTVVRISNLCPGRKQELHRILKSCGKVTQMFYRNADILDVHFSITEWTNMLKILNKLNGMQVGGRQLVAEPASVIPPDVLHILYAHPEERKHVEASMFKLLQKTAKSAAHHAKII